MFCFVFYDVAGQKTYLPLSLLPLPTSLGPHSCHVLIAFLDSGDGLLVTLPTMLTIKSVTTAA